MSTTFTRLLSDEEHIDGEADRRIDLSVPHDVYETPQTPTPSRPTMRQRLLSNESHESDSSKATSLGYCDSGHYSSANASDTQPVKTLIGSNDMLRQKDQALFLALQDVRRLRSELERLSKSEKWYKQELRQQKHARLEALEKLYGNERNYMQENQRLQRECLRLYAKCGDIERELEQQRVKRTQEARQKEQEVQLRQGRADSEQRDFEYEQQQALIVDQQQLIEVLRKQKRALLADFKRLNEEKDAQIYELQRNIALLEAENLQVTKKCKTLLDERRYLEETIAEHSNELMGQQEKQRKLELAAQATGITIVEQQRDLEQREKEINELQHKFKHALQNEVEPDAIHQLSVDFQKDLREKTQEIMALKNAQQSLQQEIEVLNDLQAHNEQQQRELEHLEAALADKNCELGQLQESDARKCAEIAALKAEVAEYQNMARNLEQREQEREEGYIAKMLRSQEAIKNVEMELINANQRYANMCVLCERTRFELDMREIELRKLKFEKSRDVADVQQLRDKLSDYLKQTAALSVKIQKLEEELNERKEVAKVDQGTQWTVFEQIKDELMKDMGDVVMQENVCRIKKEHFMYDNEFDELIERDFTRKLELEEVKLKEVASESDFKRCEGVEGDGFYADNIDTVEGSKRIEEVNKKNSEIKVSSITKDNSEDEKCSQQFESLRTREFQATWKNEFEDPELQDINVKISDIMGYLKQLENENKSLKNFIEARVQKNVEEMESEMISKSHHLASDNELSKHDFDGVDSEAKTGTTQKDVFGKMQSKLDVMNEYLKDMQMESNVHKELIHNLYIQNKAAENISAIEQTILPDTQHNEVTKEDKFLNASNIKTEQKKYHSPHQNSQNSDDDFANLAQRLLHTHQLIEELQVKNAELTKLLEDRTKSTEQQKLQEEVIKKLNEELNAIKTENHHKNAQIQNLQTKLSESQTSCENLVKKYQEIQLKFTEMKTLNHENVVSFHRITAELDKSAAEVKTLQFKLLKNDARLYKIQKRKHELEYELEEANKKLKASKNSSQQERQQQAVLQLNAEETKEPFIIETRTSLSGSSNDTAELQFLRERVADLESELKHAYNADNQQRSERIELLNKLLEQQNQKVTQLNAAQADWEELLNQLNAAHAQEAATSAELQQKRADLEELNELFHKQNFELQTLYQINQAQDSNKDRELQALKKTCAQQEAAMKTQADLIENLHVKNQHLEKTINEDYAAEVGENKKELRILRQQLSKFGEERQNVATRMQEMEKELSELRQAKRQAIIVPQLVLTDSDTTYAHASNADSSDESNGVQRDYVEDHLRILSKVLEHEYKRKAERSELHIGALLSNIKRLKRSLSTKEQEINKLQAQQMLTKEQHQELQVTKSQLLEVRHRYEHSQATAKSLEQQLTALRKQYENTDCGKIKVDEAAHEVANLIDDHKKLIQQSAVNSKRPKTSTILDLIQRSNRNVPNLNKLETSIEELRHDIQQYIGASQNALSMGNFSTQAYRQPSLLDELHQAAIANA